MRLSLGTVQFGLDYGIANQNGKLSLGQASQVLSLARLNGLSDLDTAIAYGDAESQLGKIGVESFRVVTKLPPLPVEFPADNADTVIWVRAQLSKSLRRLNCTRVYGLLLHRSADLLGPHGPALIQALEEIRTEGLVQKLGISIYAPSELNLVMPLARWELVQAPFNIVDRRLQTSGWLRRLKEQGVEVHTRSAFLQGLLLTTAEALPSKFLPWLTLWQKWQAWQLATDSSALGACLSFVHSFPEIDRVVVGVDGPSHLQGILDALLEPIPPCWPQIASDDDLIVNPSRWVDL